jgi:translation initiation factor 1
MSNSRLVYSTEGGRRCVKCGWPLSNCQCSKTVHAGKAAVPARITAKLRMEKKGRGGKTVTIVHGLPANDEFLRALCGELKRACGCGGAATADGIELQGDLRDRVRAHLERKGFIVKG